VSGTSIFGRCDLSSIQAGTAVTFNGRQTYVANGNVGVAPGTAITGNVMLGTDSIEACTISAIDCAADELIAYEILKVSRAHPKTRSPTLISGVYFSSSGALSISAMTLTLDGNGDYDSQFIFQTVTTITTATATSFILINGAQAKNVYWQVESSATLGLGSSFVEHVLAGVTINVGHATTVIGRLLAQAAVNFEGADSVTLP
jgi:hypothetical protein